MGIKQHFEVKQKICCLVVFLSQRQQMQSLLKEQQKHLLVTMMVNNRVVTNFEHFEETEKHQLGIQFNYYGQAF